MSVLLKFLTGYRRALPPLSTWISNRRVTIRAVGMLASANLTVTVLALIGSLVQAHFITPGDLGFVRKYTVVAGYAVFLNLGLVSIMQFEYPLLMARGEPERAKRTVAIVQSWTLLASVIICGVLSGILLVQVLQGHWREAAAWGIQVVAVWSALFVNYLTYTYRSGQEFERLARGQFWSAIAGTATIPAFFLWPFPALVARSVASSLFSAVYLYRVRPVKVGWCLPRQEFLDLAKRGLRLYAGSYLRYNFWLTVEIWFMLRVAGDTGVGLLTFSKLMAETPAQILMAVNQVFIPRLAQKYGQSGNVGASLRVGHKPTLLNLGISVLIMAGVCLVLPLVIVRVFPNYAGAIPLMRILSIQAFFVSVSLPIYMMTLLEGYQIQLIAAAVGIAVFAGTAFVLESIGLREDSVAWGTVAGQGAFTLLGLLWVFFKAKADGAPGVSRLQ
jgi:hypothetical protein